ncbi:phenylacetate-CoA oxygenase subunit PaaJ [soil metagenome]
MVSMVMPLEQAVWAALADVEDPEIPTVSVVDLGVVRDVEVAAGRVRVELLPTFVGCPAIEIMRDGVRDRLAGFAPTLEVEVSYAEPWTTERITPEGRRKLRESGFAPPSSDHALDSGDPASLPLAECPFCGSRDTATENLFGPTLCRSIHFCLACRQPFEQFKLV